MTSKLPPQVIGGLNKLPHPERGRRVGELILGYERHKLAVDPARWQATQVAHYDALIAELRAIQADIPTP